MLQNNDLRVRHLEGGMRFGFPGCGLMWTKTMAARHLFPRRGPWSESRDACRTWKAVWRCLGWKPAQEEGRCACLALLTCGKGTAAFVWELFLADHIPARIFVVTGSLAHLKWLPLLEKNSLVPCTNWSPAGNRVVPPQAHNNIGSFPHCLTARDILIWSPARRGLVKMRIKRETEQIAGY